MKKFLLILGALLTGAVSISLMAFAPISVEALTITN